jgi:hypothetical protein
MRRLFLILTLACACGGTQATTQPDPGLAKSTVPAASPEETALMDKLRANVEMEPQVTVDLADEGEKRFPESTMREEREAMAIRGLINLQKIGSARGRAELFLKRYPDGPFTAYVQNMTGVHVTPGAPKP